LARDANVAPSTQNQALSALLFLYKEVLKHEIGWLEQVERAKKPQKLPVVLSRDEIKQIFAHLKGVPKIMAGLLYGSGLRGPRGWIWDSASAVCAREKVSERGARMVVAIRLSVLSHII
jgi:integrase